MRETRRWLKTIPGLLLSGFFLWLALRKTSFHRLLSVHLEHPFWLVIAVLCLGCGYALRSHRWWLMLRRFAPVSLSACASVFLISFAANNILPFRLGDVFRTFSYTKELRCSSATVLSTVVLERLLDLLALLTLLVIAISQDNHLPFPNLKRWASLMLAVGAGGLLVLMLGLKYIDAPLRSLLRRLPRKTFVEVLEAWFLKVVDSLANIGFARLCWLVGESLVIWAFEAMVFVSGTVALGISVAPHVPLQALVLSNLATLMPSTPGYVGTYHYAATLAMTANSVPPDVAAVFAILVHALIWLPVTLAGGIAFLIMKYKITRGSSAQHLETVGERAA